MHECDPNMSQPLDFSKVNWNKGFSITIEVIEVYELLRNVSFALIIDH